MNDIMYNIISEGLALPVDIAIPFEIAAANELYMIRNNMAYALSRIDRLDEVVSVLREDVDRLKSDFVNLSDTMVGLDSILMKILNGDKRRTEVKGALRIVSEGLSPIVWGIPVVGQLFGAALALAPYVYEMWDEEIQNTELRKELGHQRYLMMENYTGNVNSSGELKTISGEETRDQRHAIAANLDNLDAKIRKCEKSILESRVTEYCMRVYFCVEDDSRCVILAPLMIEERMTIVAVGMDLRNRKICTAYDSFEPSSYPGVYLKNATLRALSSGVFDKPKMVEFRGSMPYMAPPDLMRRRFESLPSFVPHLISVSALRERRIMVYLFLHRGRPGSVA